ncbi:MAG: beta-N-acetylhexosaminidase [Clostridia bacterium]|nr:beta-N-acetylhexosaminidase [Clostridia bacterium]
MNKNFRLGAMLDCSRCAVPTVEAVKAFALDLKKMGYTTLLLYTEDTYEIPEEPLWGHFRGRYSKEELKELDGFCAENGLELIPCVQTLAHLDQIFTWDKLYEKYKDAPDVMLVGEEKTYELIDNIFQTLSQCYSTKTIHIGMDEAVLLGSGRYYNRHGARDKCEILLEHLNRVSELAKPYGFTLLIWSDMFFHLLNKGKYYQSSEIPEEIVRRVPENVRLVYWDYYNEDKATYDSMIKAHKGFGKEVWFAGGAVKWFGFHSNNQKTFRAVSPAMRSCSENGIDDIFITLWGDNGNECPVCAVLPSLVYAARCAKGDHSLENARKTFEDLFGERWDDFMLFDLAMPENLLPYRECATGAKEMLYGDCFLGKFDSTVSGTGAENKVFAEYAEKLGEAKARSKNYGYVFESYEKLCRVLAVKYDLGYRTRTLYQAGDKEGLEKLIDDYAIVIERVEEFYVAFKKMWFAFNKPHGFDVHDIRLGGLLQRLRSCKGRLEAYIKGETERIEELEEELVNALACEDAKRIPRYNVYSGLATLNRL